MSFETITNNLESDKVSIRRRGCTELADFLVHFSNKDFNFQNLLFSLQTCLRKDAEKIIEDARKKSAAPNVTSTASGLLIQVITYALKEGIDIKINNLFGYIIGSLKDPVMKKCFKKDFLDIIRKIICDFKSRVKIGCEGWKDLYVILKELIEEDSSEIITASCFKFCIKWGPLSGLPSKILRDDFAYITNVLLSMTKSIKRQEEYLQAVIFYCEHLAKDCRRSCCKLGEDVMPNLLNLYEVNGKEENIKTHLVDFFILQMALHHPNGVTQNDNAAYASDWINWNGMMRNMHKLLSNEIILCSKSIGKNYNVLIGSGAQLFVQLTRQLIIHPDLSISYIDTSPPQKRQKIELVLQNYIQKIQVTKDWIWIHIINLFIETYPFLIDVNDYFCLQKILYSIQIENNEEKLINNVYTCFSSMLNIEKLLDLSQIEDDIRGLWGHIGAATTRAFGLNQHKDKTEKILQKLILKGIIDFNDLLETYQSSNTPTLQTIKIFNTGLEFISHNEKEMKQKIINCLLPKQNLNRNYLCRKDLAKVLVKSTLKVYKRDEEEKPYFKPNSKYDHLKDFYLKTILDEDTLVPDKECVNVSFTSPAVDHESYQLLIKNLQQYLKDTVDREKLFSEVIFLTNICQCFTEYNIEYTQYIELMKTILNKDIIKQFPSTSSRNERDIKRLSNCFIEINQLLSLKISSILSDAIRNIMPKDFLRAIVLLLNDLQDETYLDQTIYSDLKILVTEALSKYALIGDKLNKSQIAILENLSAPNYNYTIENDCKLLITFLKTIKLSKPGTLPDIILSNILLCIEGLANAHFEAKAEDILEILCGIYPHISHSNNDVNKSKSVCFLKPFYDSLKDHGPNVCLLLLDCIEVLCKYDPQNDFSRWSNIEIIKFVPDMLKSDYFEIRLKAIDVLVVYFENAIKCNSIQSMHRQEEVLENIYDMSFKVFEISGDLSNERRKDEGLCRTASVLLTFVKIIIKCDNWIKDCIYNMIKITHIRGLKYIDKAIKIINKSKLGNTDSNIMENYISFLLEKWLNDEYVLKDFPYKLFNCDSILDFYKIYFDKCAPILILRKLVNTKELADRLNIPEVNIIEKTAPIIFSTVVCDEVENLNLNIINSNTLLLSCSNTVGADKLIQIFQHNLDFIILNVLDSMVDDKYLRDILKVSSTFTSQLSVNEIKRCFHFIGELLFKEKLLIALLTHLHLPKIEKIMLTLKENVYHTTISHEKLKYFHRYTVFIDFITEVLLPDSKWRYFFIRDVIYTLLNIIEKGQDIASASCRYLFLFLKKILPNISEGFKRCLHPTINALKRTYLTNKNVSGQCKKILTFIILENIEEFKDEIKKLDVFPDCEDFNEIRTIQKEIADLQLEQKILQFLDNTQTSTIEESLFELRTNLATQKPQLLTIVEKLEKIGRFSEDCDNSLIHRLVCVLSRLSNSTNQKVSLEAARCLGEIGPVNLQTLVLQSEKIIVHEKHPPIKTILGVVIYFLNKYLIECNIKVIKNASKILYEIFNTKEGNNILSLENDFGYGNVQTEYLTPYFSEKKSLKNQNLQLQINIFIENLQKDDLWCPNNDVTHDVWITTLVSSILKTFSPESLLYNLAEICEEKVELSENLLGPLLNLLISIGKISITNLITNQINYFFLQNWNSMKESSNNRRIALNKQSVKCMLNVVNYLRVMRQFNIYNKTDSGLDLDCLKVAKAAEFCANHFSALYYAELWGQKLFEKIQNENDVYCEKRGDMIDNIYENIDLECGETLHNILKKAYKSIGELDALPGCGTHFLLQSKYRIEHFKELGKFDQVCMFYSNQKSAERELFESLKNCGLYICPETESPDYECLWRLSKWSFEEKKKDLKKNDLFSYEDFEKYRFYSLKALQNNNIDLFQESSTSQYLCITNHLTNISLESCHSLYPILSNLRSLIEMEDVSKCSDVVNLENFIVKWNLQDKIIKKNDFQYFESIIAQRLIMLKKYILTGNNNEVIKNYIVNLSLKFAEWGKDEGHYKESLRVLDNLKHISSLTRDSLTKIDLMDAQLSWGLNNTIVAKQILNKLCRNRTNISTKLYSLALKLTGKYLSETQSENTSTIIQDYLIKSVNLMGNVERNQEDIITLMDTYYQIALFADKEYQQIKMYMKSDLFQRKVANMEQAKKTAQDLQKQKNRTNDEKRAAVIHDKNSNIDNEEIITTKKDKNRYLILALKYYLLSFVYRHDKDIQIFQMVALFLENRNNPEITSTIQNHLHKLPSYKFIVALPQLIPHLSENNPDLFNNKVNKIVQKCAMEHPHHTLPLLLALSNAYKDREFDDSKTKTSNNDARVTTAKKLIETLKKEGLKDLITKLDFVSNSLIELAYCKDSVNNDTKRAFTIPRKQSILSVKEYANVLVPAKELAISVTKDYSNIVGISSFDSKYQLAGGINRPKRITCRGTDGVNYSLLVKGQDDLRQDAVMQQVFTIMNNLLSSEKFTKHLRIRTYKIVPLSMRSGVLKWADNSMPIGAYLTGGIDEKGAHQTYRPNDKSPSECKSLLQKCANKGVAEKLKIYKLICKGFKPVFHHFFEYYFPQPAVWYERRRAYTQSVATTSMCGYILGIGDRHTNNILIDKITAEVIHIDFGIAFEQGRVLPTPETVPFRLTRDIVDGMGISGVEGVFRRSCEKTMKVLRQNAQIIITILEVLLYDPLYVWTVTSAEATKRQCDDGTSVSYDSGDSSNEPTNVSAERALLRLREKLQGSELGYPRSIEHQVGSLIQQAIDPENLCRLYFGWQPYV